MPVQYLQLRFQVTLDWYSNKKNWIDFNCGELVKGVSLDTLSNDLFEYVLSVASGKKVKSEEAGFHDMAIFKQGVTL